MIPKRLNIAKQSRRRTLLIAAILVGGGLIVFGIALLMVLPGLTGASGSGNGFLGVPAQVNFPAPKLYLSDLNGKPVTLESYQGKVVLLNNWASWCPPCQAEMPELEAYYEAHSNHDFVVIAIDAGESLSEVKKFIEEFGLTFVVWPDMTSKSLTAFETDSLPSSYVIDRQGIVRLAWMGPVDRNVLEKYVTPLLEE